MNKYTQLLRHTLKQKQSKRINADLTIGLAFIERDEENVNGVKN